MVPEVRWHVRVKCDISNERQYHIIGLVRNCSLQSVNSALHSDMISDKQMSGTLNVAGRRTIRFARTTMNIYNFVIPKCVTKNFFCS